MQGVIERLVGAVDAVRQRLTRLDPGAVHSGAGLRQQRVDRARLKIDPAAHLLQCLAGATPYQSYGVARNSDDGTGIAW